MWNLDIIFKDLLIFIDALMLFARTIPIWKPVRDITNLTGYWRHMHVVLLRIVDKSSSFDRRLIVFTVVALAVAWAKNAGLKTLTVLLQTRGLFASTSFCMLFICYITLAWGCNLALTTRCIALYLWISTLLSSICCRVDFGSECIWSLLKGLLDSLLT